MTELMTIGAFAAAVGLTPKALRLYAQQGLLRPAAVDNSSGYRYYDPDQQEQARTIAQLRRIGMPLAHIQQLGDLAPIDAADHIAAYWRQVAADTASRGRMAAHLINYLTGRTSTMEGYALQMVTAAHSSTGPRRDSNEDTAHCGDQLIAVADGVRGDAGRAASAAAVSTVATLRPDPADDDDLRRFGEAAVAEADAAVRAAAEGLDGETATTLTALQLAGDRLLLSHVGDGRAYRLRDGRFTQLTRDHTYVQALVDAGRLAATDAPHHPRRGLLVRALCGSGRCVPDVSVHDVVVGDRYVLATDGLHQAVPAEAMRAALADGCAAQVAVDRLVALAWEADAGDNVACAVADVAAV